ncbi:hypothetical protein NMG60_11003162 [Bertholletia excelsa]
MKKLYGNKKGKVHPSSSPTIADRLSLLPAAVLALTAALSPGDREVLAYLISCSGTSTNFSGNRSSASGSGGDHPTQFDCNCFRCYMSYWVRWDESPNRQLIHEILDSYEDGLFRQKKNKGKVNKRERRNKRVSDVAAEEQERNSGEPKSGEPILHGGDYPKDGGDDEAGNLEKGSVRKLVSFIGERIWGVWGV